jgi:hypothetical protein
VAEVLLWLEDFMPFFNFCISMGWGFFGPTKAFPLFLLTSCGHVMICQICALKQFSSQPSLEYTRSSPVIKNVVINRKTATAVAGQHFVVVSLPAINECFVASERGTTFQTRLSCIRKGHNFPNAL